MDQQLEPPNPDEVRIDSLLWHRVLPKHSLIGTLNRFEYRYTLNYPNDVQYAGTF
jgi:hypothetical protein